MKLHPAHRQKMAARNRARPDEEKNKARSSETSKNADKARGKSRAVHAAGAEKEPEKSATAPETIMDPVGNVTRNIEDISEAVKSKDFHELLKTAMVAIPSVGGSLVLPPAQFEQIKKEMASRIEKLFGA